MKNLLVLFLIAGLALGVVWFGVYTQNQKQTPSSCQQGYTWSAVAGQCVNSAGMPQGTGLGILSNLGK